MHRFTLSLGVGIVAAVVLTAVRGGFEDAPYVVPVFGAAGFGMAYCVLWLLSSNVQRWLGGNPAIRPKMAALRDLFAVCAAVSCLFWTGRVIQGAGYGGWLVALFLGVAVPLVVCLISIRLPVLWGLLTATCIAISTLAYHPSFRGRLVDSRAWERFWERDATTWMIIWTILSGLSLIVSLPLSASRRRS